MARHPQSPSARALPARARLARRWPAWPLALVALVALLAVACGSGDDSSDPGRWDAASIAASQEGQPFVPVNVNSNLGVGETRLAFALFRPDQTLVDGAEVTVSLYQLADDPEAAPTETRVLGTFAMTPRRIALEAPGAGSGAAPAAASSTGETTMYTSVVSFDEPGIWGALLDVEAGGETYEGLRVPLNVLDQTSEPAVGEPAPRSRQRTLADVDDITEIDSSQPPNPEMHSMTLEEAIDSGQPVLVAFVTPMFCQTRFCGPVMEDAIVPAWEQYGDRVHFVHIEPFDLAQAREGSLVPVEAVRDWRLQSEPFIAVIDADGLVSAKFEGIVGLDELTGALEQVVSP